MHACIAIGSKMDLEKLKQDLYATGEKKDFVHLHLHTDFSLKDGIGKPTQYAKKAIEIGMPALAVTDHGSIGAHPSFFMYCRANNIKPIVGVELYVQNRRSEVKDLEAESDALDDKVKILKNALKHKKPNKAFITKYIEYFRKMLAMPEAETDDVLALDYSEVKEAVSDTLAKFQAVQKEISEERDVLRHNQHAVLLAKNETGRKHITKIVSNAAREGFYYKPRSAFDFITANKEGIILTSACLSGVINSVMMRIEDETEAVKVGIEEARPYQEAFGDDFYIELMLLNIDRQRDANRLLIQVAKALGIKTIITNDVHYLDIAGAKAQEISLMLGSKDETGEQVTMKDKKRQHAIKEILDGISNDTSPSHIKMVYTGFMELDRFEEFRPTKGKEKGTITLEDITDIVTGKTKFKRVWEFSTKDVWFKDRHQIIDTYIEQEHYKQIPTDVLIESLNNTLELAKKIDTWDWDSKEKLPKLEFEGQTSYERMVDMTREGWQRKAQDDWGDEYVKRVKYELGVVRKTEMADYFIIVADYIQWAKNNGVVVGAGRGCFLPTNKVQLVDKSEKNIEDVIVGERIANKFWGESKVEDHFVYDIDEDVIELTFENRTITCTIDHKFLTRNRGWVKAIDLTDEDEIVI
jgi:DNA polymerase III alpha subunit